MQLGVNSVGLVFNWLLIENQEMNAEQYIEADPLYPVLAGSMETRGKP
jgi:hypothetical protein